MICACVHVCPHAGSCFDLTSLRRLSLYLSGGVNASSQVTFTKVSLPDMGAFMSVMMSSTLNPQV